MLVMNVSLGYMRLNVCYNFFVRDLHRVLSNLTSTQFLSISGSSRKIWPQCPGSESNFLDFPQDPHQILDSSLLRKEVVVSCGSSRDKLPSFAYTNLTGSLRTDKKT